MEKKEYAWWPSNAHNFQETFNTIDDAIRDAQRQYDESIEMYEKGYSFSPIIEVGVVERFDEVSAIRGFVGTLKEYLDDSVSDFASGSDIETEVYIDGQSEKEFIDTATEALFPLVKKAFFLTPTLLGSPICESYDLIRKVWIKATDSNRL